MSTSGLVARIGTGVVLGVFGFWELTAPGQWAGYVPHAVAVTLPPNALVLVHGWVLFMLAVAALIDLRPLVVSWAAVAVMTEVVVGLLFTEGLTSVAIRDVGLLALAVVWVVESRPIRAPQASAT